LQCFSLFILSSIIRSDPIPFFSTFFFFRFFFRFFFSCLQLEGFFWFFSLCTVCCPFHFHFPADRGHPCQFQCFWQRIQPAGWDEHKCPANFDRTFLRRSSANFCPDCDSEYSSACTIQLRSDSTAVHRGHDGFRNTCL
jgi:hypothetical protein